MPYVTQLGWPYPVEVLHCTIMWSTKEVDVEGLDGFTGTSVKAMPPKVGQTHLT